ncbi:GNAT family N-acetyltransferase [Nesterenkonia halophila]|uniref:GNAT family N-acetyltransferase n=1 Tax=Nesterenkonia halophila TaxID=302044 RepID=UPI001292421D|nr:GNAT family N-acetyltransferase [Nesterenkonia halophila]
MPHGTTPRETRVRRATVAEADVLARLLHDFNTEFGSPTPGPAVLADRLRRMLPTDRTRAWLVTGPPTTPTTPTTPTPEPGATAAGLALVTRRANVWSDHPVDLLDELYVVPALRSGGLGSLLIRAVLDDARAADVAWVEVPVDAPDRDARRFYRRHGFLETQPETGEPELVLSQHL